jgi:hypothetical protein
VPKDSDLFVPVSIELHAALLLQDSREAFEWIEAIAREVTLHPDTLFSLRRLRL